MESVESIHNYRHVDDRLGTSGQPTEEQLGVIANAGYTTVVNLALHDDPRYSLPDEAGTVAALGMNYVHIPVIWNEPTTENLHAFFDAMDRYRDEKVWVHCAANWRVSAFLGLYRILRLGWEEKAAFEQMATLFEPDEVWAGFIRGALASRPT